MRKRIVVALAILWSSPTLAQSTSAPAVSDSAPVRNAWAARTFTALVGWFPGAVAGGFIGSQVPRGPCSCDDPGLEQTVIGILVGGAIGAGVGAAIPQLRSHCSFGRRVGLGLLGAAAGVGVGLIPVTDGSQALTIPVFSIVGAAMGERRC